jgi:hypothetical protein
MIELDQNDSLEETEYDAIDLDEDNLGDSDAFPLHAFDRRYRQDRGIRCVRGEH